MTRANFGVAFPLASGRHSGRVSGLSNSAERRSSQAATRSAALALAVSLVPVVAEADGFWQTDRDSAEPAATTRTIPFEVVRFGKGDEDRAARWRDDDDEPAAMITMPGLSDRFGLAVRRDGGRPKFSGLAYQATPSLRISADGGWDFDDRSVSGGIKFRFAF